MDELVQKVHAHAEDDPATHRVIGKLIARSKSGQAKYGATLDCDDLTYGDWIRHAQEEAMDLANYLQVLIRMHPLPIFESLQEEALAAATTLEGMIDYR